MRLNGKVAVVTGGAKGLGGEMCQLFAKEGAKVVAVDMMPLTYENANVEFYKLNVTSSEDCKEFYDYVIKKYGKVDVLVNNAGITRDAMTRKMTDEPYGRVQSDSSYRTSDGRNRRRQHNQHFLRRRRIRQYRTGQLLRDQGGRYRSHQDMGKGICQKGRARESKRNRSRLYHDGHDENRARGFAQKVCGTDHARQTRSAHRNSQRRAVPRFGRSVLRDGTSFERKRRNEIVNRRNSVLVFLLKQGNSLPFRERIACRYFGCSFGRPFAGLAACDNACFCQ